MSAYISFLTALGWSLLDSIWQMAALWAVYYVLTENNKRLSSAGKHNLALMFIVFGLEWFFYSLIHLLKEPLDPIVSGFIPFANSAGRWIPCLSAVYLLMLTVRFLQYGFQYPGLHKNKPGKSVSPELQFFADRNMRLLGITKKVQVYISDLAGTAETSGFLKPLILLPVSLVTRLTPQQLEAILIHEIFHIRRNDYLINIFTACFRGIFFFNPFARLFYKALARERELACDDGVLEQGYEPAVYAEALFYLEKFRQADPGFSLAADGHKPWLLMERITRVLGKPGGPKSRFNPLVVISLLVAFVLFGLQQKSTILQNSYRILPNSHPPASVSYEFVRENIQGKEKEMVVKAPAHRRFDEKQLIEKQMKAYIQPPSNPEMESDESPVQPDQAIFAENNIIKNYSNQQAAGLNLDPIPAFPGTPYVPSVSLSYEALPEIMAADSLNHILRQNGMKEIMTLYRLKEIANLKQLEADMEKSREDMKQIEIKNQKLILLDQKNIKPLLKEMQKRLMITKQKIDRLRMQLQISEEEIIHI